MKIWNNDGTMKKSYRKIVYIVDSMILASWSAFLILYGRSIHEFGLLLLFLVIVFFVWLTLILATHGKLPLSYEC